MNYNDIINDIDEAIIDGLERDLTLPAAADEEEPRDDWSDYAGESNWIDRG